MPDDLDDFDIDPTRPPGHTDESVTPYRPGRDPRKQGLLFPVILVVVAVAAVGLLGVLYLVFRHPAPAAAPSPSPVASSRPAPSATPVPTATAVVLPPLDDSDDFVRHLAAALGSGPELARLLSRSTLVRTLTVVVSNIAEGATPRPHLDFLAPAQRFRAARGPRRATVPDPAGFAGYDTFADAVAALDAGTLASTYETLAPLFDAAYRDLGHPEGGFGDVLDRAIDALLAVPVLGPDVALVPHATGFRYADPRLEGLTAAQKQFLRMGPRNVRLVQGKLRELKTALARPAPEAAAVTPRPGA
jgi:hypothetical protein